MPKPIKDQIIDAVNTGDVEAVRVLAEQMRLEAALGRMKERIMGSGNVRVEVVDWDEVDRWFDEDEPHGFGAIPVFDLAREAFLSCRLSRDVEGMVAAGLIISKAVVPKPTAKPNPSAVAETA